MLKMTIKLTNCDANDENNNQTYELWCKWWKWQSNLRIVMQMMKMTIKLTNCDSNDENEDSLLCAKLELLSHSVAVGPNHNEEREQNQKATHIWRRRIWENLKISWQRYGVHMKTSKCLEWGDASVQKRAATSIYLVPQMYTARYIGRVFGLKLTGLHLWFLFTCNFW